MLEKIRILFTTWHFGSFYLPANERNEQIDTDIKHGAAVV